MYSYFLCVVLFVTFVFTSGCTLGEGSGLLPVLFILWDFFLFFFFFCIIADFSFFAIVVNHSVGGVNFMLFNRSSG